MINGLTKKQLSAISVHLFEDALDGIIISDRYGVIKSINQETVNMFGYTPKEIIGENISKLIFSMKERTQHDTYLSNYYSNGESKYLGRSREQVGKDKRNNELPVEVRVMQVQYEGELVFLGFVRDISERKRLEKREENLRTIQLRQIINVKDKERARQANELHEEIGQLLMAIRLGIGEVPQYTGSSELLQEYLKSIKKTLDSVADRVVILAKDLMPSTLIDFGLEKALLDLAAQVEKNESITVKVAVQDISKELNSDISNGIFRICQDAVRNSIRYSVTKEIVINLMQRNDKLVLIVRDFGAEPKLPEDKKELLGRVSYMRERARILGGTLNVNASLNKGTSVYFKLPIQ